jgi:hypothetical protein
MPKAFGNYVNVIDRSERRLPAKAGSYRGFCIDGEKQEKGEERSKNFWVPPFSFLL